MFLFTGIFRNFSGIFPEFLPKFSPILLKFVKIFKNSVVDFICQDKQALLIVLIKFLWSKILDKYFKIQPFLSKTGRNKLLWSTLIRKAGSTLPDNNHTTFVDSKEGYFCFSVRCECSVIKNSPVFDNFTRWLSKMLILILNFQLTKYLYLQHSKYQLS